MLKKFRVTKSVDKEGKKVITYTRNDQKKRPKKGGGAEMKPNGVQVTVKLP